jgi:putative ubiquitin-RnfH superfamily antitoxin RatB of RatAB toxin-antitoxin module
MELKDLGVEIAIAMSEPIEKLHEIRAAQRERWFKTNDKNQRVEVYDTYIIGGKERKFSRIGLESPDKFAISKVTVKTGSDMEAEVDEKGLKKLTCHLHSHSDKTAEVEVTVEFERVEASEGLLALHKRAVREIKEACMELNPEPQEEKTDG